MPALSKRKLSVAALITCFNRKQSTLACLGSLEAQQLPAGHRLLITLVDDGSSDGTGDAVRKEFPQVEILEGTGELYWCGGMRVAWNHAAKTDPDFYLLLNDDTRLSPFAVGELLQLVGGPEARTIAVASIFDPRNGRASYGGVRHGKGLVPPSGAPGVCDTFNANCVLIPRAVYREMGVFHHVYTHAMGDTDYGFQSSRRGIRIVSSGRFLGECELNVGRDVWRDCSLGRWKRLKALQSPKGLPFREWMEFNRRNSGWKWLYYTISPILRILAGR